MAAVRKSMVAILLVCGLAALGALLGLREPGSTDALPAKASNTPKAGALAPTSPTSKAAKAAETSETGTAETAEAASATEAPKVEPPPLDRPLRIVSLGWDLAVPGHLANGVKANKDSVLAKSKLEIEIRSVTNLDSIKSSLANGGAHKSGADVAILPLPEMVASYEDLRALKPQIFFVAGWSRGRDALFSHKRNTLLKLPRSGKIELTGSRGTSSTLLSLYLLDLSGIDSDRVALRSVSDKASMFSAVDRGATSAIPKDASLAVTSADASALIPFVAIAPEGFLQNRRAIAAFIAAWLEGVEILEADVPTAARQVSAIKGAPDTLTLVRKLGLVEYSGLRDNVRRAGLAGRDPVDLASLFQLTWRLWRGIDVLTTPAPETVPIDFHAIASLALQSTDMSKAEEVSANFTTKPMLRATTNDLESAAMVAGVFARSSMRLGAFAKKKASTEALDDLAARYGHNVARFEVAHKLAKQKTIVLEIYSAP